jgi:aspartyl protease family protein
VIRLALLLMLSLLAMPAVSAAQTPAEANDAGKAAYQRGDLVTAERMFSAAAAAVPKEPLYHYHRGVVLVRLGRFAEARAAYELARALKPPAPLAESIEQALRDLGRTSARITRTENVPSEIALESLGGVWLAEVTLNGSRRARFLIDTGATFCAISPALADELGMALPRTIPTVTLRTANGDVEGRLASLESIRVGDSEAQNVPTVVITMQDFSFDGILGNSYLARYAATLDAQRRVLHLRPRS